MPQEFEQAQSASASQESEDIIESVGVQVDEEYVGSFVQKGGE